MDFATNWIRVFRTINRDIRWINAFGVLNELAAKKIMNKLMNNCFIKADNILDKSILKMIETHEFSRRRNINRIQQDMVAVVSDYFADGDVKKGQQILDEDETKLVPR